MIIRFENIDKPSYSAQFTFDNNGFDCAEYDYSDFFDVTDPDLNVLNSFTDFLNKIQYNIFTDDFVAAFSGNPGHNGECWHSFKVNFSSGDYRKFYFEGFNSWTQNDFDSINACSCLASFDNREDLNTCPNNLYDDFVDDSWVSSKCIKITKYFEPLDNLSISYYNYLDVHGDVHGDVPCIYNGFLPVISFKEPDVNYPRFKIFAYDFNNFSNDDCKYGLFLHIFYLDSDNKKKIKTVKVGSFGVYHGDFYFENFYGNKVATFSKRYFNFYGFFNTNTSDNVVDFMKDNFNDLDTININSFGNDFVFELKKEDYAGVYMSTLDCECLTNAINSLNNTLESLFKIEDNNICDIFVNTMAECFGVGSYPDGFKGLGQLFSNTFLRGNNLDKSVFRTLLDIDFADSFSSAFNLLSGAGSVFTNNAINPANYRSIYDDFHDSFYNSDCGSWFIESFNEAFNLTNCEGSVFKANDNIWNEEDSLCGILYKQLDKSFVLSNSYNDSAFWGGYRGGDGILKYESIPRVLAGALFKNNNSRSFTDSVFMWRGNVPFTDVLKNSLFSGIETDYPGVLKSVFGWGSNDSAKILNHSCSVNPNSIKFCESVSQPAIPIEISSPVQISQPEDEWGEPVPFKMDWKPLLDLLSEALFCQFGNDGLDPRASWGYSVFNKLLYPLHPEGCDDKVGLPELDFSEGFVPDNIFVNSNGLIARYNSEIYK